MTVRVVLNDAAVKALLKSPEVQRDLEERARRIAQHAGEGFEPGMDITPNRARGYVVTSTYDAIVEEARNRTLTRSLDAGR